MFGLFDVFPKVVHHTADNPIQFTNLDNEPHIQEHAFLNCKDDVILVNGNNKGLDNVADNLEKSNVDSGLPSPSGNTSLRASTPDISTGATTPLAIAIALPAPPPGTKAAHSTVCKCNAPQPVSEGPTLKELINTYCPKFKENSAAKLHPFLLNSHFQLVYSQLVDATQVPIHYQRNHITYPDKGRGAVDVVNVELTMRELAAGGDGEIQQLQREASQGNPKFSPEQGDGKVDLKDLYTREEDIGAWKWDGEGDILDMPLPSRTRFFQNPETEFTGILKSDKPLILFLHGLSGGSQESYIKLLIRQLIKVNRDKFDIMVLNSRGCLNSVIQTPRLYNGIWTDDVRFLVNEHILKHNPHREVYLLGFSLGASVLANYLAQEAYSSAPCLENLKLGIAISAPWDLYQSSQFLNSSFIGKNVYSPAMAKSLFRLVKRNYGQLKKDTLVDQDVLHDICRDNEPRKSSKAIKYLGEFDDAFTSKMFGFNNAEEYYKYASSATRLHRVRTPMVLISALDDPVVGPYVPRTQVQQNPYLHMLTTMYGGHVGWFERLGDQWYNEPIAQLVKAFHEDVCGKGRKVQVNMDRLPRDVVKNVDRVVVPGSYSELLQKKQS